MSKATFYEHFDNKEDCIVALFDAGAEAVIEAMRQAGAQAEGAGPAGRMQAIVHTYLEVLAAFPDEAQTLLVEIIGAGPAGDGAARPRARRVRAHDRRRQPRGRRARLGAAAGLRARRVRRRGGGGGARVAADSHGRAARHPRPRAGGRAARPRPAATGRPARRERPGWAGDGVGAPGERGGGWRARRPAAAGRARRSRRRASRTRPTWRRCARWRRRCTPAAAARASSPGARPWPPRSARRSATRSTGGGRSPGFGDPARADPPARPGPGRPRRQPHRPRVHRRPLGRLPVRRPAPRRPRRPADLALARRRADADATAGSPRRSAAPRPPTSRCRRSATRARPGSGPRCRSWRRCASCSASGATRWDAALRLLDEPPRPQAALRPRRRGGGRTVDAARLLPPQPAEHVHRAADPGDARRRARAGARARAGPRSAD